MPIDCTTFEHSEFIISSHGYSFAVYAVIYRPPNSKLTIFLSEFEKYLSYLSDVSKQSDTSILLASDFNINLLHVDTNNNVSNFIDIIYSQS